MNERSGILSGGNWIVDKLKFIDTYPQQDALSNILSQSIGNGGSPFNILIDLAKLGAKFPIAGIGLVGDDADGEWIKQQCVEHGHRLHAARHPCLGGDFLHGCHDGAVLGTPDIFSSARRERLPGTRAF